MRGQRPEPCWGQGRSGNRGGQRDEGPESVARGFQTVSTQMAEWGRKPGLDLAAGWLVTSTGMPQSGSGEEDQR